MHVMFFGYGRHDDCSEAIMIVGLAMAFSNGFAEVSVLRVYYCIIGRKPWVQGSLLDFPSMLSLLFCPREIDR